MKTSYFYRWNKHQEQMPGAIRIAIGKPRWYDIGDMPQYKPLMPNRRDIKLSGKAFEEVYLPKLDELDPRQVWDDLHKLAGEGNEPIILCHESPGRECHRHLVAQWLESHLGISVSEWEPPKPKIPKKEQLLLF